MNKRGSLPGDPWFIIIILFILSIIVIFVAFMLQSIRADVLTSVEGSETSTTIFTEYHDGFANNMDMTLMIMVALLCLTAIVSAFAVQSHPVFYIVFFILLVIVVMVSGDLADTYDEVTSGEDFVNIKDDFRMTNFSLTYLPMLTLVIMIMVGVVMWSK